MKILLLILLISLSIFATPLEQLQHAKIYKDQNISGWVMSEKLDGIRGYWDGHALYTKSGKRLSPPTSFVKDFPPFELDGELWIKRQDFESVLSAVLKDNGTWKGVTYNIFEVPYTSGDFITRLNKARAWFNVHPNKHIRIIEQQVCQDDEHLQNFLNKVIAMGGEGVMVKDPALEYMSGRSSAILKVKKAQDMEGTVVGINYQKNSTRLRSLTLQLTNGVVFKLGNGFSDKERNNPPPIGTVVTFKYYGFTKRGKPKFASFMRIRQSL